MQKPARSKGVTATYALSHSVRPITPLLRAGFCKCALLHLIQFRVSLHFMSDEKAQVEAARAAFANDFDRYGALDLNGSSLSDAEGILRAVADLKVRHTGKKSAIAATKKLIGKVPAAERGDFGQLV